MVTISIKANLSEIVLSSCLQSCILSVSPGPKTKFFFLFHLMTCIQGQPKLAKKVIDNQWTLGLG